MDDNISRIHRLQRELEDQEHDNHLLQRQVNELEKDAKRYRALRHQGKTFGLYVVIGVEDARVGTMTYSGDRLDDAVDEMVIELGETT